MPGFELVVTMRGHSGMVGPLAISADGAWLVSGDENGEIRLWSLPGGDIYACAMDLEAMPDSSEGITFETTNSSGETVTYTLPCGAAVPAGAVCTCNCVTGSACSCVGHSVCSCVGYSPCSCVGHSSGGSHYWYPN
jgi:hypothetical protein